MTFFPSCASSFSTVHQALARHMRLNELPLISLDSRRRVASSIARSSATPMLLATQDGGICAGYKVCLGQKELTMNPSTEFSQRCALRQRLTAGPTYS